MKNKRMISAMSAVAVISGSLMSCAGGGNFWK